MEWKKFPPNVYKDSKYPLDATSRIAINSIFEYTYCTIIGKTPLFSTQ